MVGALLGRAAEDADTLGAGFHISFVVVGDARALVRQFFKSVERVFAEYFFGVLIAPNTGEERVDRHEPIGTSTIGSSGSDVDGGDECTLVVRRTGQFHKTLYQFWCRLVVRDGENLLQQRTEFVIL